MALVLGAALVAVPGRGGERGVARADRGEPGARAAGDAPGLRALLDAAHRRALAAEEQARVVDEAEAGRAVAAAALWPTLGASAGYAHNQREVAVAIPRGAGEPVRAVLTPSDQLDAALQLTVPLVDLGSRRQLDAAEAALRAGRATLRATTAELDRAVVRAYYQWLGGEALVRAAEAAEAAAAGTLALTEQRAAAGLGVELDLARARAQQMRARRAIADARLVVAGARRQLGTLTGARPEGAPPALPEDLDPPPDLAALAPGIAGLPELAAAEASRAAAVAHAAAERAAALPVLAAFARERVTNAAGFGEAASWAAGLQLSWSLDRRALARGDQARAAAATSAVRLARVAQDARDRLTDAWDQVEALRAAALAAAAGADAARLAAGLAGTRNAQGTATTQQVVDAQAEALDAEVELVRARADLAAARALLRLAAGQEAAP